MFFIDLKFVSKEVNIIMQDNSKAEIIALLKSDGYRISETREALINVLQDIRHFNVKEIIQELKKVKPDVNMSTVYNNLNFLVEKNLIKENKFNNSQYIHYEIKTELHAHLICLDFENVIDIDDFNLKRLRARVEQKHNFEIFDVNFNMYGRCSNCQK
jgi:Fe2+ or Zn2+ uptake regulation protein